MRKQQTDWVVRDKGNFYIGGKKVTLISGKSGGHRIVGYVKDYNVIFKADAPVSRDKWFRRQTQSEIEVWKVLSKCDKKHFAQILDHGTYSYRGKLYHWHIQETLPMNNSQNISKSIIKSLKTLLNKYKLSDLWIPRNNRLLDHFDNWTIIDNKPVIYDWGVNGIYDCTEGKK